MQDDAIAADRVAMSARREDGVFGLRLRRSFRCRDDDDAGSVPPGIDNTVEETIILRSFDDDDDENKTL